MSTLALRIEGMTCQHCVRAVNEALAELPGVTVERVEIGKASVSMDDARVATAQVIDAVQDAGYVAHVVD